MVRGTSLAGMICLSLSVSTGAARPDQRPVHSGPIHVEYGRVPSTSKGLVQSVDAVVRVKIEGQSVKPYYPPRVPNPTATTEYRARVVETIKGHAMLEHPGGLIAVRAYGGSLDIGTHTIEGWEPGLRGLQQGGEYVLFLYWSPGFNAFTLAYGPDGVFELSQGMTHPFGNSEVALKQKARVAGVFLAELRLHGSQM